MEMSLLLVQYHSIVTAHLTVEELEHELKIRGLDQIAPRSTLERVLRNSLKKEDEQPNVQFDFSNIDVDEELETCDDKMNALKSHLESRRSKKAPDQCFKTRLIHILFRMERLKRREINEECSDRLAVIAGECVRLLNAYFSMASHLPEVRAAELAIVNESLSRMLREESEGNEREREDGVIAENRDESGREIVNEGDSQNPLVEIEDRNEGAVGGNNEQEKLAAENKRLLVVVSQLLQRVVALEGQQSKEPLQDKQTKTSNSTQVEVEKIPEKSSQQKPMDFLAWLKERNNSLDSSGKSSEKKKVEEKSSQPGSSEKERSKTNSNRLPVHKWTIRYDGMDNGRRLNEFLKEVEFNARSEGFSEDELYQSAHHLFTHKARAWFMEVNGNYELGSWKELVRELKHEFLPIDIDYVYERQTYNRKQGTKEKFQDYYLDMVRIFRGMSSPWDERRKFDVLFRNTREDCRIAMLAANVIDIATFDVGQRVYKRSFRQSSAGDNYNAKLGPVYSPCIVIAKKGTSSYEVSDMNGKSLGVFSAADLKA